MTYRQCAEWGVSGQRHTQIAVSQEDTWHPLYSKLGEPQVWVWTGEGKRQLLDTVWVLSPSLRVSSESLYRLSYLGLSFYGKFWIECREISEFREVIRVWGKRISDCMLHSASWKAASSSAGR